jgi:hypothetical protein
MPLVAKSWRKFVVVLRGAGGMGEGLSWAGTKGKDGALKSNKSCVCLARKWFECEIILDDG